MIADIPRRQFPPGFIWGVSTSSYQIEGAVSEDGRGPSIWDVYSHQSGRIANGDTGDVACDHYHRYAEDVGLMRDLGVDAYRFSVAWPRVLPTGRGAANEAGLAFYDRLIDALTGAGIEPWLCLYHWDLPQALQDSGGWTNRDCAQWFADYATLIGRRYGDRVKRYATFNEPSVFTLFGYCLGGSAPGISDQGMLLRAIHHVNLAHGAAVDRLRAIVTGASLGAVHNCQPCRPAATRRISPRRKRSMPIGTAHSPIRNCSARIRRSWLRRWRGTSCLTISAASTGRSTGSGSTIIRRTTSSPTPKSRWD
jgi:beta-glucosidase